jgi:hypothetical protein
MTDIQMILPVGMLGASDFDSALDTMLRNLALAIEGGDNNWCSKYGTDYENEIFVMRRYYWGDCDCGADEREEIWSNENKHSDACYQTILRSRQMEEGVHWSQDNQMDYELASQRKDAIYAELSKQFGTDPKLGAAIHCTCGHQKKFEDWIKENGHTESCALVLPNFLYKPTGFKVCWYKYIGRDMKSDGAMPSLGLGEVSEKCIASIAKENI